MLAIAQAASGVVYVTPIQPTLADWAWLAAVIALSLLLILWPTIYALMKRRWRRALVYFCMTLPVFWIELNRAQWWGSTDPEYDFSPLKNPFLYYLGSWPVLTTILWTITAISDVFLAEDTRAQNV